MPCRLRDAILQFTDGKSRVGERGQLVRHQCSKPAKVIQGGVAPDADEAQLCAS
jgi:hypothetical protein